MTKKHYKYVWTDKLLYLEILTKLSIKRLILMKWTKQRSQKRSYTIAMLLDGVNVKSEKGTFINVKSLVLSKI